MTNLTLKARAGTFPLDQLLAAKRRGVFICIFCGAEEKPMLGQTLCTECNAFQLRDPDDLIVMNMGPDR